MSPEFSVFQDEGNRWVVSDRLGGPPLGGFSFRSHAEAIDRLRGHLAAEGLEVDKIIGDGLALAVSTRPTPRPPVDVRLTLPGPAAAALERILNETGDKPGEAFGKALGLYLLALDAKKRGLVVGSADSAEKLDTEFTGF